MSYQSPRRIVSNSTAVTVATVKTALETEAGLTASNSFRNFNGADIATRTAHPLPDITNPDTGLQIIENDFPTPSEDGGANANSSLDWASKGCYDYIAKRAMWASCGQGTNNAPNSYARNTHCIFDETYNSNVGRWYSNRAFLPSGIATTSGINHLYDSICIDVEGRRMFKGMLDASNPNSVLICNLDTLQWSSMAGPPQDTFLKTGALEFIPTRGSNGALWCYGEFFGQHIWEFQFPNGPWTQLNITFASQTDSALPMSYNPRSNKVFCGGHGTDCYIIDCATLAKTQISAAGITATFEAPSNAKLCKEPGSTATGWLYYSQSQGRMYHCSPTGTWTAKAAAPSPLNQAYVHSFILIPIDAYGVVWIVGDTYTFGNTNPPGTNPQAWLFKP